MLIKILDDAAISPMAEFNANDATDALSHSEHETQRCDFGQLTATERTDCDCLVVPYRTGNWPDQAFQHMLRLHEQGMSLVFLGDQPHIDSWYPIRNMQSFDMHCTRYQEPVVIKGLTDAGREIFGNFPEMDEIIGKKCTALRITGFPEDVTHSLVDCAQNEWAHSSVVAIERKGERFGGARMAQIGFSGGEPREVALGVYPMEWTYDPGLLTRDWTGIKHMLLKLVDWCEPQVSAEINMTNVHKEDNFQDILVSLMNPSAKPIHIDSCALFNSDPKQALFESNNIDLAPGERKLIPAITGKRSAGLHSYSLKIDQREVHNSTEHVVSQNASDNPIGFGASSHLGYRQNYQSDEQKHFIRELKKRGCQYFRMNVPWEEIEPEPGVYDWGLTDDMLAFAEEEGLCMAFWMFATTRGCGLGDAGVPAWTLKEAAIDRNGNPGNFPSIWSPYYREHYFNMVEAFCKRYAEHPALNRFILDFGNSDFPYGYYYYVNDTTLFDYSPHERNAFILYLREQRSLSLEDIISIYDSNYECFDDVPVPFVEQKEAWGYYLDFRTWSIGQGMDHVISLIRKHALKKCPPDAPGHGLGSIADITANYYDIKRRHLKEERKFQPHLTRLHSAAETWGGEAWQVGGTYKEFDDALFGSLRFNATYNTVPGPDINVYGEDLSRIAYIRRSMMGAERRHPRIAYMGRNGWNHYNCFGQVASRLDQSADYLHKSHRFDFSCYDLFIMPTADAHGQSGTGGGGAMYVPADEPWYWLLRESIESGLNVVVFPETCIVGRDKIQKTFLRQVCDIMDISYGPAKQRTITCPPAFGGGSLNGVCKNVIGNASDEILLRDDDGDAILIRRQLGTGSLIMAGFDDLENNIDGDFNYTVDTNMTNHSLVRLIDYLGLDPLDVQSQQSCVYKDKLQFNDLEFFIAYSHNTQDIAESFAVRLDTACERAVDLATGDLFPLRQSADGWHHFNMCMHPRKGRYLQFGI